jgi:hypothetical protein
MSETTSPFEYASSFEQGEVSGGVRLGRIEAQYEELFSQVIEDGVITAEERAELERAADALGLDRGRLQQLERALTAAYEARRRVRVLEIGAEAPSPVPADAPRATDAELAPVAPAADLHIKALERRVQALEARIVELEAEIEELRAQEAVEVDLSGVAPVSSPLDAGHDPEEILRRLRPDPRDPDLLRALYRAFAHGGDRDRQWCAAHALVYVGAANAEERERYERHGGSLARPSASLSREGWKLLYHPDQEPLVGEIFAAVLGPVLLGRITALRRDGALPKLDPAQRLDPVMSTATAARCFGWAGAILGVRVPPIFADQGYAGTVAMVPATAPSLRLGKPCLSGRTPGELAFLAGEHLSYFRDDAFMRALFHSITELEDIFLAALAIGNPGLPLAAAVRTRVAPLAQAIEPLLDPVQIDRLRGHFLRFVEDGGRANLQRWASAVDGTAARAGLLLVNDLKAAETALRLEDPGRAVERMDDLLLFAVGERYAKLRRQIGVAVED